MKFIPIPSQTAGPYFHLGCMEIHSVSCLAGPKAGGERIRLVCRVLDGDGVPVTDAMVEIWQADSQGKYNHPHDPQNKTADAHCGGFGRLATDESGTCVFQTVKPGRVPGNDVALQAPHFNVSVFARGILKRLATRIYFAGEAANREDPVLALVPEARRATLLAQRDPASPSDWRFDVHLCGADETVFFDI